MGRKGLIKDGTPCDKPYHRAPAKNSARFIVYDDRDKLRLVKGACGTHGMAWHVYIMQKMTKSPWMNHVRHGFKRKYKYCGTALLIEDLYPTGCPAVDYFRASRGGKGKLGGWCPTVVTQRSHSMHRTAPHRITWRWIFFLFQTHSQKLQKSARV